MCRGRPAPNREIMGIGWRIRTLQRYSPLAGIASGSRSLLNNGEAKTPNGEFRPFRRFRAEGAAPASKRRRSEPACLARQGNSALTNGERKFDGNKWLPRQRRRTRLRRRFYRL